MNKFLAKLRKEKFEKIQFKAQADGGVLTLYVYDVIGADFFGEGITVTNFKDAVNAAGDFSSITLRINSPGGDVFEAVAIYNLLRGLGKPVNVYVDGVAASAASVIVMAGDTVTMGEGAVIMIHNAMTMVFGNGDELRQMAATLDTISSSIADIYVAHTGQDKKAVQKLMDAETWMDATEAIDKGFASASAKDAAVTAKATGFDLAVYNNVPEALKGAPVVVAGLDLATKEEPVVIVEVADPTIELMRKRIAILKMRS